MLLIALSIFAVIGLIDGVLNLNEKPNLGWLLFSGQSGAVQRYGSAGFYFVIAIAIIWFAWFAA